MGKIKVGTIPVVYWVLLLVKGGDTEEKGDGVGEEVEPVVYCGGKRKRRAGKREDRGEGEGREREDR